MYHEFCDLLHDGFQVQFTLMCTILIMSFFFLYLCNVNVWFSLGFLYQVCVTLFVYLKIKKVHNGKNIHFFTILQLKPPQIYIWAVYNNSPFSPYSDQSHLDTYYHSFLAFAFFNKLNEIIMEADKQSVKDDIYSGENRQFFCKW